MNGLQTFIKTIINRRFDAGEIQLLHILCGEETLGCIYNFVYQGVVYHYQNGFNYERFSNSPGIVSLALAIPYNAAQGHKIFDFMAGDSEYKRSLSTDKKMMQWYVIQQKTPATDIGANGPKGQGQITRIRLGQLGDRRSCNMVVEGDNYRTFCE